jgi:2'-5' RNA ligase
MTATTYHLWLKPSGLGYEVLAGLIRDLAQELGAPVFEPHVTLLGHLEGSERDHLRRTARLGEQLGPFEIELGRASYREEHFKCLFLQVSDTASVKGAHTVASEVFRRAPEEYMPHLSLVYGSYPEERKRAVIAGLPALAQRAFPVGHVYLLRADSEDPRDWHEMLKVPMQLSGTRNLTTRPQRTKLTYPD